VAAFIIRAIDQETANASGAHLGEGNLLRAGQGGHSGIKARSDGGVESHNRAFANRPGASGLSTSEILRAWNFPEPKCFSSQDYILGSAVIA
jgi:hypothetical protein